MRNAEYCFRSQPISDIGSMKTRRQLPDAKFFFRLNLPADIAFLGSICVRLKLIKNPNKGLCGCGSVLDGSQTPGMEIAQTMSL